LSSRCARARTRQGLDHGPAHRNVSSLGAGASGHPERQGLLLRARTGRTQLRLIPRYTHILSWDPTTYTTDPAAHGRTGPHRPTTHDFKEPSGFCSLYVHSIFP